MEMNGKKEKIINESFERPSSYYIQPENEALKYLSNDSDTHQNWHEITEEPALSADQIKRLPYNHEQPLISVKEKNGDFSASLNQQQTVESFIQALPAIYGKKFYELHPAQLPMIRKKIEKCDRVFLSILLDLVIKQVTASFGNALDMHKLEELWPIVVEQHRSYMRWYEKATEPIQPEPSPAEKQEINEMLEEFYRKMKAKTQK
jgi:hypothetical protein